MVTQNVKCETCRLLLVAFSYVHKSMTKIKYIYLQGVLIWVNWFWNKGISLQNFISDFCWFFFCLLDYTSCFAWWQYLHSRPCLSAARVKTYDDANQKDLLSSINLQGNMLKILEDVTHILMILRACATLYVWICISMETCAFELLKFTREINCWGM